MLVRRMFEAVVYVNTFLWLDVFGMTVGLMVVVLFLPCGDANGWLDRDALV